MAIERSFLAFAIFESSVVALLRHVVQRLASHESKRKATIAEIAPADLRPPVQEYNPRDFKVVLWEPESHVGSAAFVANLEDGWATLVYGLCLQFKLTCYNVRVSLPTVTYPIVEFQHYNQGEEARIVRAMKDDPSWRFFERGSPLAFETTAVYRKRRISDRFPRQLLFRYLDAAGWNVEDPAFWRTRCSAWTVEWNAA